MSELAKHIKALAEKQAGPISETLSVINPLNTYLGGSLLGGGAALAMPTRSLKQQANYDSTDNALRAIANVLVPGYGPYNAFKRIGAGIRSPEMKAIKADREQDKARRELESIQKSTKKDDNVDKAAGWKTELAGSVLNPINVLIGNKLGAGAAALTQTRTLNEQSESDDSTWSNLFIPGQAQYNWWKRVGAATRSPEMLAMRRQATIDRLEREAGTKNKKDDNEKQSKVYEASEAVDGLHVKHTKMNHKKCTPGEFGAMVKEAASPLARMGKMVLGNVLKPVAGAGAGVAAMHAADRAINNTSQGSAAPATTAAQPNDALHQARQEHASMATWSRPYRKGQQTLNYFPDMEHAFDNASMAEVDLERGQPVRLPPSRGAVDPALTNRFQHYGFNNRYTQGGAPAGSYTGKPNYFQGMTKTQSARDFGAYVKQSFNINQYLPAAGVGAVAGAGLGALGGLINPGEEDEYDDQGRVVGRKQRSRFGAMLRNALMGAGAGGIVGGAGSALLPQYVDPQVRNFYQTMDYLGSFVRPNDVEQAPNQQQPKAPFTPLPAATTTAPMPGGKLRAHPGTKTRAQLQSDREQSLNSGEQIPEISFPNAG